MIKPLNGLTRAENAELIGRWIKDLQPTHFVTLATNWDSRLFRNSHTHRSLSPEQKLRTITADLHNWGARVDRDLLGHSWQRKRDRRIRGFGVPEHLETNIHLHCVIDVSASVCSTAFVVAAMNHWVRLVPTGNAKIYPFEEKNLEWYISKEGRRLSFSTFGLIGPQ